MKVHKANIIELTTQQLIDGLMTVLDNAEELLNDAIHLIHNKKYYRAMVFIIAAMEESEKAGFMLGEIVHPRNLRIWTLFWKNFYSHRYKQESAIAKIWLNEDLDKYDLWDKSLKIAKKSQPIFEKMRQQGLYVDFIDGKFMKPGDALEKSEFHTRKKIEELLKLAANHVQKMRDLVGRDQTHLMKTLNFMKRVHKLARKVK